MIIYNLTVIWSGDCGNSNTAKNYRDKEEAMHDYNTFISEIKELGDISIIKDYEYEDGHDYCRLFVAIIDGLDQVDVALSSINLNDLL